MFLLIRFLLKENNKKLIQLTFSSIEIKLKKKIENNIP